MSVIELAPVVKTLELKRSADDAFRIYVHEAAKWWPLETHALSPENNTKAIDLIVEPHIGGRVYEVAENGRTFDWGEVLAYEPGRRFAMTWQLGRARDASGEVDVIFEPTGPRAAALRLLTAAGSAWAPRAKRCATVMTWVGKACSANVSPISPTRASL
jgi:uncharacterized protein YndB with AHSA1/START domain